MLEESLVHLATTDAVQRVGDGDPVRYWSDTAVPFYVHMAPYEVVFATGPGNLVLYVRCGAGCEELPGAVRWALCPFHS